LNGKKFMAKTEHKESSASSVTEAQIKQWKQRWGNVAQITVTIDDEGNKATGFFKKPGLDTIAAAATRMGSDPIGSGRIVFENCWLGGDEIIKTNDEALFAIILEVNKLFKYRTTEVKNL